jgi:metal-responsive CopG/Arc/MetJ family transcriptional regulator
MKITITVPDFIYKQLRKRAAEESVTISDLVVRAIERYLEESKPKSQRRVKLPIVRSKRPGKLQIDNAKIYEIISFP